MVTQKDIRLQRSVSRRGKAMKEGKAEKQSAWVYRRQSQVPKEKARVIHKVGRALADRPKLEANITESYQELSEGLWVSI